MIGTEVGWSALVGEMPNVPAFVVPSVLVGAGCSERPGRHFMAGKALGLIFTHQVSPFHCTDAALGRFTAGVSTASTTVTTLDAIRPMSKVRQSRYILYHSCLAAQYHCHLQGAVFHLVLCYPRYTPTATGAMDGQ